MPPRTFPFRTQKPTEEPLTRDEAVKYLRAQGYPEDELEVIDAAIKAARANCEEVTGLQLMPAPYAWLLDGWWNGGLVIPKRPFRRLLSVKYVPETGAEVALTEGTHYAVERTGEGTAEVHLLPSFTPPALRGYGRPVRVEFEAGFHPAGETEPSNPALHVPDDLRHGMLAFVASRFDRREDSVAEKLTLSARLFALHTWPTVA